MRRGFSSTEILTAVTIMAVALVPIITMFSSGTRQTAFNEYHVLAQMLGDSTTDRVYETIVSRGFTDVEKLPQDQSVPLPTIYRVDASMPSDPELAFFDPPDIQITNLGSGLAKIAVTMSWKQPNDRTSRTLLLERLIARPEEGLVADYPLRQVPSR